MEKGSQKLSKHLNASGVNEVILQTTFTDNKANKKCSKQFSSTKDRKVIW